MKKKPLFTETTEVPVNRSMGEIVELLMDAGAISIHQTFEKGQVIGLAFVLPLPGGVEISYKLPVRVDPVFKALQRRRINRRVGSVERDREQAARVAWRQMFWWLKCQLTLVELGMVETTEVLLPFRLGINGQTFFEQFRGKLLAAPAAEGVAL